MSGKTAVIWHYEESVRFLVVEDDWRRFDGLYINTDGPPDLEEELLALMWDTERNQLIPFVEKEEFAEAVRNGAWLIVGGFSL